MLVHRYVVLKVQPKTLNKGPLISSAATPNPHKRTDAHSAPRQQNRERAFIRTSE